MKVYLQSGVCDATHLIGKLMQVLFAPKFFNRTSCEKWIWGMPMDEFAVNSKQMRQLEGTIENTMHHKDCGLSLQVAPVRIGRNVLSKKQKSSVTTVSFSKCKLKALCLLHQCGIVWGLWTQLAPQSADLSNFAPNWGAIPSTLWTIHLSLYWFARARLAVHPFLVILTVSTQMRGTERVSPQWMPTPPDAHGRSIRIHSIVLKH